MKDEPVFELLQPVGTLISDPYEGHTFVPTGDEWPFSQPLFTQEQVLEMLERHKEFVLREHSATS